MKYHIPGQDDFEINTLVLDLNGTISVGGVIVEGVRERVQELKSRGLRVVLFTGNTRGDADKISEELGIEWMQASDARQKKDLADGLDPSTCASIGNGLIDLELMQAVKLRVVTLQAEGVHVQTLLASDVVVPSILDALDLFIDEQRLIATLRR